MKLSESDLRRLYQDAATPRSECPPEDLLLRAAQGELDRDERERVAAHIAACRECARYYQVAFTMRPLVAETSPRHRVPLYFAAAAALVLAIPLLWSAVRIRQDRDTIASLQEQLRLAARKPAMPPPSLAPIAVVPAPQIDTPIVDLDPDVSRGAGGAGMPSIALPPTSDVFTLILHFDEPVRDAVAVTIADATGRTVWSGTWTTPKPVTSLTLTLHEKRFPAGAYKVRVGKTEYRFRRITPQS